MKDLKLQIRPALHAGDTVIDTQYPAKGQRYLKSGNSNYFTRACTSKSYAPQKTELREVPTGNKTNEDYNSELFVDHINSGLMP